MVSQFFRDSFGAGMNIIICIYFLMSNDKGSYAEESNAKETQSHNQPRLSLYHRSFCMFCSRVIGVINRLSLDIDDKNIWKDERALMELQQATGRSTVPVLRIESQDGSVTWMPESNDIVQYLSELDAQQ